MILLVIFEKTDVFQDLCLLFLLFWPVALTTIKWWYRPVKHCLKYSSGKFIFLTKLHATGPLRISSGLLSSALQMASVLILTLLLTLVIIIIIIIIFSSSSWRICFALVLRFLSTWLCEVFDQVKPAPRSQFYQAQSVYISTMSFILLIQL